MQKKFNFLLKEGGGGGWKSTVLKRVEQSLQRMYFFLLDCVQEWFTFDIS